MPFDTKQLERVTYFQILLYFPSMSVFPFFFSCSFSFFWSGHWRRNWQLFESYATCGRFFLQWNDLFQIIFESLAARGHSQSNFFPEDLGELFRCWHVDMNRFEQLREQQRLDSSSCYEKDLLILICFDFFHHCYSVATEYVKKVNNFQRVYFLFHKTKTEADLRGNGEES